MTFDPKVFKDYDVRGTYPDQLNGEIASAIASAIVIRFKPKSVAICRDMRLSSNEIFEGFAKGFTDAGVNVFDAGLTGTEIAYFIAGTRDYDMSIMISASHNPPQYNGLKMVLKGPIAISGDTGLVEIRDLVAKGAKAVASETKGAVTKIDVFPEWRKKVLSFVEGISLKPLKVVVDAGNGMAGKLIPLIFDGLPLQLTKLYFDLDGHFPNHVPNPLVESNNVALIAKVKELHADLGLTFDGDADRVFFVDNTGRFVSGTLVTALLAKHILSVHPGEYVLYSAVCGRVVPQTVEKAGGKSQRVRVGHSFMKNYMRKFHAIFAGEHSGHYYHRDFFNSESGVLTALMVISLICSENRKFSEIVGEVDLYPESGEINFAVDNIPDVLADFKTKYAGADSQDELDGLSIWFKDYWFNLRSSKTEPLLRLNVEADTKELLDTKTKEIMAVIKAHGGKIK